MTNTLGKYQTCEFFADKCKLVELLNMRVSQAVAKANSWGQNLKVSTFWHIPVIDHCPTEQSFGRTLQILFECSKLSSSVCQKISALITSSTCNTFLTTYAARALDVKNIEVDTSKWRQHRIVTSGTEQQYWANCKPQIRHNQRSPCQAFILAWSENKHRTLGSSDRFKLKRKVNAKEHIIYSLFVFVLFSLAKQCAQIRVGEGRSLVIDVRSCPSSAHKSTHIWRQVKI